MTADFAATCSTTVVRRASPDARGAAKPNVFPPSLGFPSPRSNRSASLPVWLRVPEDKSQLPGFLQTVRERLILVERRLHYLRNEKVALLACLWGLGGETQASTYFPTLATSGNVTRHDPVPPPLPLLQCGTVCDADPRLSQGDISGRTAAGVHPSYAASDPTLWEMGRGAQIVPERELVDVACLLDDAVGCGSASPQVVAAAGEHYTSQSNGSQDTDFLEGPIASDIIRLGGPDHVSDDGPPDDARPPFQSLVDLAAKKRKAEERGVQQDDVSDVNGAGVDQIVDLDSSSTDTECDFVVGEEEDPGPPVGASPNVAGGMFAMQRDLTPCAAAVSNEVKKRRRPKQRPEKEYQLTNAFTNEYWDRLSDDSLRQWMRFFGMKASRSSVRRNHMLAQLGKISTYLEEQQH